MAGGWTARLLLLALAAVFFPREAWAAAEDRTLRVGTKEAAPFVVRRADGTLGGPSLRLWDEVAQDLGVRYELEERDLAGLLAGLRDGSLDVSVAAITVTSEREATVDFSHPFHTAGLGIVARQRESGLWVSVVSTLFSTAVLQLVAVLAVLQLGVGVAVWLLERRRNPKQFAERPARGIFAGFWWSTVTMTTVGYGDKAPITPGGRVIALAWMLCSVVIIATFTGTVASRLTVAQMDAGIRSPSDLAGVRVAVLANSTSDRYAGARGLDYRRYPTLDDALQALAAAEVEAVVHDAPLLELALESAPPDLELLPPRFMRQDYAIALPEGSSLRERINRILPRKLVSENLLER